MNLRRVWAVARKEFLHVLRDFRSLVMAIAIAVMLLTLFGYALTLDVDNVPMVVWDQSGTARSRGLHQPLRRGSPLLLDSRSTWTTTADLERAIDTGRVMMGLVVPRDFAQQIDAGRDAPVQLIVDGSDSNTATIAIGYADVIGADLRPRHDRASRSSAAAGRRCRSPWTCGRGSGSTPTWNRGTSSSPA